MVSLGGVAEEFTPVATDLGAAAPDIDRFVEGLDPSPAPAPRPWNRSAKRARPGTPALQASLPVVKDTRALAAALLPVGETLAPLLTSLDRNDGIARAMDFIFYSVGAVNGFDALGHYLRAGLIVNQCTSYATAPVPGCSANFVRQAASQRRRPGGHGDSRGASRSGRRLGGRPAPPPRRAARGPPPPPARRHAGSGGAAARLPVRERRLMRGAARIAGNPVLIGAATVLVVIVAVFLSYNANHGLPFVPSYALRRDAERGEPRARQRRADRRHARRLRRLDHGQAAARRDQRRRARAQARRAVAPLPRDTTVLIRSRSALGSKYVQLTRGTSDPRASPTATRSRWPSATPAPVEFDEFLNMFDPRPARASKPNLRGFGDALAGRGHEPQPGDRRVRAAPARRACRCSRNLSSSDMDLARFIARAGGDRAHRRARRGDAGAALRGTRRHLRRAAPP